MLYLLDCILECLNGGVLNNETCTCDCALTDYTGDKCQSMCVGDVCVCVFKSVYMCLKIWALMEPHVQWNLLMWSFMVPCVQWNLYNVVTIGTSCTVEPSI